VQKLFSFAVIACVVGGVPGCKKGPAMLRLDISVDQSYPVEVLVDGTSAKFDTHAEEDKTIVHVEQSIPRDGADKFDVSRIHLRAQTPCGAAEISASGGDTPRLYEAPDGTLYVDMKATADLPKGIEVIVDTRASTIKTIEVGKLSLDVAHMHRQNDDAEGIRRAPIPRPTCDDGRAVSIDGTKAGVLDTALESNKKDACSEVAPTAILVDGKGGRCYGIEAMEYLAAGAAGGSSGEAFESYTGKRFYVIPRPDAAFGTPSSVKASRGAVEACRTQLIDSDFGKVTGCPAGKAAPPR